MQRVAVARRRHMGEEHVERLDHVTKQLEEAGVSYVLDGATADGALYIALQTGEVGGVKHAWLRLGGEGGVLGGPEESVKSLL